MELCTKTIIISNVSSWILFSIFFVLILIKEESIKRNCTDEIKNATFQVIKVLLFYHYNRELQINNTWQKS